MGTFRLRRMLRDEVDPYPTGPARDPIVPIGARGHGRITQQEATMRLREKGGTDDEVVTLGWDEAQAALAAGTHEVAEGAETEKPKGDVESEDARRSGDGLDGLTRPELAKLAEARGLEVSPKATADDIVKALRAPPAK